MNATTYEVRESSRETPGESTLLRTAPTYWEAMELARDYSERGALAFVREVPAPPAEAEAEAFDFGDSEGPASLPAAYVVLNRDQTAGDLQYWAEVETGGGEVLHGTAGEATAEPAMEAGRRWCRENGYLPKE